uniref:NADH-ubiquinone oxidoreductase chain 4L n=1 Tax=Nuttallochiton mirandus TaxID=256062 RepID=A0A6H1PGH2_NULMI|nr:NADH dehydrogenase subunit 4L [Nuttallochiton mirandus]
MMNFYNPPFILSILTATMAFLTLCAQRKHLLNTLLTLEIIMVAAFLLLLSITSATSNEGLMIFILLTLAASEASVGLAMLVILIRAHGNDYVTSLSINKC